MHGNREARLGVLDLAKRHPGEDATRAAWKSVRLAQAAEELGYGRYWVSEHHQKNSAHASPEMVAALAAQATRRIRVGTAGILLHHYSPLKVAETFSLLECLFPGRIDAGIGRSMGSNMPTVRRALFDDPRVDELPPEALERRFEEKVRVLASLLRRPLPEPGARLAPYPSLPRGPPLWMLGSNRISMDLAARLGCPFSYGLFYNQMRPDGPEQVRSSYVEAYQPSPQHPRPQFSIGVSVLCARSESTAAALDAQTQRLEYSPHLVLGTPERCAALLRRLGEEYGTDEIVVATTCVDEAAALGSYRLLAREMLQAPLPTGAPPA